MPGKDEGRRYVAEANRLDETEWLVFDEHTGTEELRDEPVFRGTQAECAAVARTLNDLAQPTAASSEAEAELGFWLEERAGIMCVVGKSGWVHPATSHEIALWNRLTASPRPAVGEATALLGERAKAVLTRAAALLDASPLEGTLDVADELLAIVRYLETAPPHRAGEPEDGSSPTEAGVYSHELGTNVPPASSRAGEATEAPTLGALIRAISPHLVSAAADGVMHVHDKNRADIAEDIGREMLRAFAASPAPAGAETAEDVKAARERVWEAFSDVMDPGSPVSPQAAHDALDAYERVLLAGRAGRALPEQERLEYNGDITTGWDNVADVQAQANATGKRRPSARAATPEGDALWRRS